MNLKKLKFCRFKDEPNEWSIEGKPQNSEYHQWLSFDNINLIVGKNATGKSRTLDAILHIADLLSGNVKLSQLNSIGYGTAKYELHFNDNNGIIDYSLDFKEGKIIQEILKVNQNEMLNRKQGKLWYEGANKALDFETDEDILAITKRDKKQHSFFEKLHFWGKNLSHYRFGRQLGKNILIKDIDVNDDEDIDLKDSDEVAKIFIKGKQKFGDDFTKVILKDMTSVSYKLDKIDASPLKRFPILAYGLSVQESDLKDVTDQREMSQGMFRALSLLVQLNYSLLSKIPSCILIDDIGEGLDYERAKSLIDLIINKIKDSPVQIIMTTNDRFVMNKIPLEYWSVIQRVPMKSLFYNYKNSEQIFDDFKYTGLNNFDFLSTEFYITGFEDLNN